MSTANFRFHGERLIADLSGALIWPATDTVIVSDLHLEKGSAFAERGFLLPPYDSRETLSMLEDVLERHTGKRVICLGDSFHDSSAFGRLGVEENETIQRLVQGRDWLWVAGNHDPNPPKTLGGQVSQELAIDKLVFRHQAELDSGGGEISGHYHPKARVEVRGRRLSAPCFVTDGSEKLILPAFGAYTGGLDVTDPAIDNLFARGFDIHMLGQRKVYSFPKSALAPSQNRLQ
ncbi:MAG TPA: phosphoesterase [Rhodospirillaceae bacterium]|nr:phosphoesterase [Rhodospirillaceae bacterium]HAA92747.1 phosphoesterase [Rhodospirillaceae bacterium]HAT34392.1 phosphoesterase [Rhodospirillaceae bacterium]|tara:strand:+ start:68 stop:766 length:699 start_codon:yes stop_codon:yes gene_type:complete